MSYSGSARTAPRRTRWGALAVGAVVGAAVVGAATLLIGVFEDGREPTVGIGAATDPDRPDWPGPPARVGMAYGAVPEGVTVFDNGYPAVTKLDPALLDALREAATDAGDESIEFVVNSGWRSPDYQNQLRREAIARYGSEEEAARWVATAERSNHVSGEAVDLGPAKVTAWLVEHGTGYGLCQIYRNEPWHYELRPEAIDNGRPPMYVDPSQDPRLQP